MEQFRKFLRDKAFALVLTACLLAAAAAGVWAVRTVRNELKQNLDAVRSPSSTAPGIDEGIHTSPGVAGEEEAEWQQQNAPAANSVANVPKADSVFHRPVFLRLFIYDLFFSHNFFNSLCNGQRLQFLPGLIFHFPAVSRCTCVFIVLYIRQFFSVSLDQKNLCLYKFL